MTGTTQQLHELPDLAAEVFLPWGHPNPTDRPAFTAKRVYPPAPADLDALDCLRNDRLGLLFRLAECVRAVVEAAEVMRRLLGQAGRRRVRQASGFGPSPGDAASALRHR